jgi:hypothetical protein
LLKNDGGALCTTSGNRVLLTAGACAIAPTANNSKAVKKNNGFMMRLYCMMVSG